MGRELPLYPDALFDYLASIAPSSALAWDCATGSGQAAQKLARYFFRVVATDASSEQIRKAKPAGNIAYQVAHAENAPIPANAVDLITVAQALHWFDLELFFREAKRVLKSNGVIAVWSYNLLSITPALDAIINKLYREKMGADPMDIIRHELAREWGAPARRHKIDWPLSVIIGKEEGAPGL